MEKIGKSVGVRKMEVGSKIVKKKRKKMGKMVKELMMVND